jgi:Xaa-Pro dipeptidase
VEPDAATDPVLAELEERLPLSSTDPRLIRDAASKVERLRAWLDERSFDSALISRRDNFAWLTMGGDSHVLKNTELGVGHLLVTREKKYLLAYAMDGPRLQEEQLRGLGYEPITNRWYEADPRQLALALGGKRVATDAPLAGAVDQTLEIGRLHEPLTSLEMDRLRWLGRQTGLIFEQTAPRVHPGMSEWDIACLFTEGFAAKRIELDVLLVGVDERAERFRHVIPTQRRLEHYVLINPAARRWGLHANVSRCLHFGPVKAGLRRSFEDASAVVAEILAMLKPDLPFADVLQRLKVSFKQRGYPEGWREHFPGGVTGYVVADDRCLTDLRMVCGQAFDWFVTLPGVMVEELALLGEAGLEIPSLGEKWPRFSVSTESGPVCLPEMWCDG